MEDATDIPLERLINGRTEKSLTIRIEKFPDEVQTFTVGNGSLIFKSPTDDNCVEIHFSRNIILKDYYHATRKSKCKPMSHDYLFHGVLDFFSSQFHQPVVLEDASYKDIETCKLSRIVLALAKGKTFYNRYEFANAEMDAELKNVRNTQLNDDPEYGYLYEPLPGLVGSYEDLQKHPFVQKILERSASNADMANLIIFLCSERHPLLTIPEFIDLMDNFGRLMDIKFQKNNNYTRPVSMNKYFFELKRWSNDANRYELSIRSHEGGRSKRYSNRKRLRRTKKRMMKGVKP